MKQILFFILSFTLCCCMKHREKTFHLDINDDMNFISCYNYEKKVHVNLNDSIILNTIKNSIKKSIGHRRDYYWKFPACYGTITFYTKRDTLQFQILGNLLTRDGDIYYKCDVNFQELLDSLIFKCDSIY